MIVMVMGVVGAGKTTVGQLLAAQLGWEFADADDFHSPESVEKIRHAIPLQDTDRAPWIAAIHGAMVHWEQEHRNVVLACSALKRTYREQLCHDVDVKLVYLQGDPELIHQRLLSRHGHFATAELLTSQMVTLEEPEEAMKVGIDQRPERITEEIRRRLGLA